MSAAPPWVHVQSIDGHQFRVKLMLPVYGPFEYAWREAIIPADELLRWLDTYRVNPAQIIKLYWNIDINQEKSHEKYSVDLEALGLL